MVAAKLFISYSHVDEAHIARLIKHLAQLERDGTISGWYDREIRAGEKFESEIFGELASTDIFLACASPDYIASNYCVEKELTYALEQESAGNLSLVPVILEHCEWLQTPLNKFKALPKDGKPIADFVNHNVPWLEVTREIRRLCDPGKRPSEFKSKAAAQSHDLAFDSRYRIRREFDNLHKRDFAEQAYDEIFAFFEVSAQELRSIQDVEARLSRTSQTHFACTVINRGIARGYETLQVRLGGSWSAIDILYGDRDQLNTSNGGFSVTSDDYQMYLTPMMFAGGRESEKLTPRDAAQMLWDDLLSKVGIDYA